MLNIYLATDGANPLPPSSTYTTPTALRTLWGSPSMYIDGLTQETCRDLGHTQMASGGMSNGAETALIQGVDLYGAEQRRILAAFELHATWVNQYLDVIGSAPPGTDPPSGWRPATSWVCPGFSDGGGSVALGWELAYNHYAVRKGIAMPQTKRVVERLRPAGVGNHMEWETLTHAGTGSLGPP